ncbi:MAG: UDP-perosamine 4-acetyltransferase [Actinomycetota bacterium]|jgi:UDP-perosamine 4-acetyltransferase|nr:UDP-perosamine 4-acetyltransferase [Actinomycetota bacterium]
MTSLYLVGAGGHAKVAIDIAIENGFDVSACIGLGAEAPYRSVPVLEGDDRISAFIVAGQSGFVAIGDNATRIRVGASVRSSGGHLSTLVAKSARISPTATIGLGTIIMEGVVVNAEATIGDLAIVNTGATVDHDCRIGSGAHLGPGSHLAGNVHIGAGAFLGAGTIVIPGITIGAGATVGAGSTVIRDVPPGALAFGVPAKIRKASA